MVGRRQVRRGTAQVALQLRHPHLERRLLASCSLGGVPGGNFGGGSSGPGPLSGLFGGRRGRAELLDLGLGESLPRRQRVPFGSGCSGGSLVSNGAVLRRLPGGFMDIRVDASLATAAAAATRATTSCIFQLSLLRAELTCRAGSPLT
jgi:hypothetical protein